jgi:hypothetical protein
MADLVKKDIRYLSRDFSSLKQNLIDFTKNYFPNTYQDFNEASPGMMFLEMAAYVGDVLSYYTDVTLQETMLLHATERVNILNTAQSLGYMPKNRIAANVKLDVFQIVPAKTIVSTSGSQVVPDYSYGFAIEPGMVVGSSTNTNVQFRTVDFIDFKFSSNIDPTEVTPFEIDVNGEVLFWLLKKSVKAVSGKVEYQDYEFDDPKPYDRVVLNNPNLIEVLYGIDSDNNTWYNVPYLAADTIFEPVINIARNDTELSAYRDETPYLLKLKKVARRFTLRTVDQGIYEIQFGAGVADLDDEELIPNPELIGNSLTGIESSVSLDIDPSNFLYTKTYGLAPSKTTIRVYYTTGTGIQDNVASDTLTRILTRSILLDESGLDGVLYSQIVASLAVTNPKPAIGGKAGDEINEIRNNALANFASQNRAVTKEDYIIRAYTLPSKYGSIAKAYITKDTQLTVESIYNTERIQNNLALNFYVLGYDADNKLTLINDATKENLKTYLNYHRILTDAINIRDAYVINIGIEFDIITFPDQNSNQVILRCINRLKQYFDVNKWQINQPIIVSNIFTELDRIEGVQTVVDVKLTNKYDQTLGYSPNAYNLQEATRNGIVFPSLDPSIFEIKYPDNDIIGRVRAFG